MAKKQNTVRPVGRPKVVTPCPFCRKSFGSVEYRLHITRCPKRARKSA